MNGAELTTKLIVGKRNLPSRTDSKSDVADLFDRSLRRAIKDEEEAPTEIVNEDDQGMLEQCDMITKVLRQPCRDGRTNFDSEAGKKTDVLNGERGKRGSAMNMPERSCVGQEEAVGNKKHEARSSPFPAAVISGGQPVAAIDAHVQSGRGSTISAASYQDFSKVLQQQLREAGNGASREWRFSFQDARLPLAQINLISQPSGGWGMALASSGVDREILARRLDELNIRLAKLNRNIDRVEIVKGRFQ